MNDGLVLILLLFLAFALLWFFVWEPKAREERLERERRAKVARIELERQAAEAKVERERRDAEVRAKSEVVQTRLKAEREEILTNVRTGVPDFILKARLEFEREYRSRGGEGMFGQEMSPLVCFGYRVGKTAGRTESERHRILEYAMAADYNATLPFLPTSYRNDWGGPLSVMRFNRIYQHLNNMADLRDGRRNFEVAVSHWRADASWLYQQQRPIVEKFRAI